MRPFTRNCSQSGVDLSRSAGIEEHEFYVEGVCGLTQCLRSSLGVPNIGWIDEDSERSGLGQQLMHESESLCINLASEEIDPRGVSARLREALNEPQRYRVFGHAKHNWNRRSCCFGG